MDAMCDTWLTCLADRWWAIALTIVASSAAIVCADYLGINRPWFLSVSLGGIISLMIMEAYPYAWTLGDYTHIFLWVALSCMVHLLPQASRGRSSTPHRTIWDYFEEVDTDEASSGQSTQKGASAWVEYS
jgi:hypothetical protein